MGRSSSGGTRFYPLCPPGRRPARGISGAAPIHRSATHFHRPVRSCEEIFLGRQNATFRDTAHPPKKFSWWDKMGHFATPTTRSPNTGARSVHQNTRMVNRAWRGTRLRWLTPLRHTANNDSGHAIPDGNPGNAMTGLLLSDDLIFTSRIVGTGRDLGYAIRVAKTADAMLTLAGQAP